MLMLVSLLPCSLLDTAITNTFFTNLSSFAFTADQQYLIAHGLNYVPSRPPPTREQLRADFNTFTIDFFSTGTYDSPATAPPEDMQRFRVPNPSWHPLDSHDYEPSPGVLEYVHETLASVYDCADAAQKAHNSRPIHNLRRRHRDALRELKLRRDIVFIDSDKNLGLVCLDAGDYRARCLAELQQTHSRLTPLDPDPLATTRKELAETVLPLCESLPLWAAHWVRTAADHHPRTNAAYTLPNFRLTIKVHKSPPEGRPITGNQKWITQPLAELVAALTAPYVLETPVFTQDSDQINRELLTRAVGGQHFLVTYDVVRLYPSIPHELCYTLLRRHLRARRCPYTDFVIAALRIILNYNYCVFDGDVYHQYIGFATGIACGAEIANLFVFVLTRFVFSRYSEHFSYHRRFIDDGLMIWTGTRATALAMFAALNALCPTITLTYTISLTAAVFLDLDIFKGPAYSRTGLLDTKTYQKPVNRYLYTPLTTEHPNHCLTSLVQTELRRYIKRTTSKSDYVTLALLFMHRML
eukprot:SAG11_NODE_1086_length_5931_cov_2.593450_4_plen_526_part_00